MRPSRLGPWLLAALVATGPWWARDASGQAPPETEAESFEAPQPPPGTTEDELVKQLTEEIKKKTEKEKPPFEIFRSQVAPFDVLPYVKPNHWSTLSLELQANHADYSGELMTAPVPLQGLPVAMAYGRDARLVQGQRSRLSLQMLLPAVPRELNLELIRPQAVRFDERTPAALRPLLPHQMLVVVLSRSANDLYAPWNRFYAFIPRSLTPDAVSVDNERYYRLVLPLEPDRPVLSPHPLTWSTISHVIWDGLAPEVLSPAQQQAMLDWLHWGGQLVLVGGAGPTFGPLRESFLAPYLPAEPSGENATLDRVDLRALAEEYRGPVPAIDPDDPQAEPASPDEFQARYGRRYLDPKPIQPASNRPIYLSGLSPNPGASTITIGGRADRILAVETRVGRGRITMLAVNPTDPAFLAWPGLDTFVRRVILRRPEEPYQGGPSFGAQGFIPARYGQLPAPDLSWVRYLSRDVNAVPRSRFVEGPDPSAPGARPKAQGKAASSAVGKASPKSARPAGDLEVRGETIGQPPLEVRAEPTPVPTATTVADWSDRSALPDLSRDVLEEALGLSVPSSGFVLRVVLAYVAALLVNWVGWYLLRRTEMAWVFAPILSIGFAVAVERAASFDLGYDAACDEVDLVEMHADYPRAHVSRFASLYSSARVRFTIAYPDDPTALALPFDTGRSLRGEELSRAVWQSSPVPALREFRVQPRSYAMFRAEQMADLSGSVRLVDRDGRRAVVNETDLELRDAVLLDGAGPGARAIRLGPIGPGASAEVGDEPAGDVPDLPAGPGELAPGRVLELVRKHAGGRPEDGGEIRLVAWSPKPVEGQAIEPTPDRHRGFTVVVVHLGYGPPPSPDAARYDALARGAGPGPAE